MCFRQQNSSRLALLIIINEWSACVVSERRQHLPRAWNVGGTKCNLVHEVVARDLIRHKMAHLAHQHNIKRAKVFWNRTIRRLWWRPHRRHPYNIRRSRVRSTRPPWARCSAPARAHPWPQPQLLCTMSIRRSVRPIMPFAMCHSNPILAHWRRPNNNRHHRSPSRSPIVPRAKRSSSGSRWKMPLAILTKWNSNSAASHKCTMIFWTLWKSSNRRASIRPESFSVCQICSKWVVNLCLFRR